MKLQRTQILMAGTAFAAACFAQSINFEGNVTGPDGRPVVNAIVVADRQGSRVQRYGPVRTDGNGHYYIGRLSYGNYKVTATDSNGNVLYSVDNLHTDLGTNYVNLGRQSASGSTAWRGRYYAGAGLSNEEWDFLPNGTFRHEGLDAGVAGATVRKTERGTFLIAGGTLKLSITLETTGVDRHAVLGQAEMVSGQARVLKTREMRIQLIGPQGRDGIVLDNKRFDARHGW